MKRILIKSLPAVLLAVSTANLAANYCPSRVSCEVKPGVMINCQTSSDSDAMKYFQLDWDLSSLPAKAGTFVYEFSNAMDLSSERLPSCDYQGITPGALGKVRVFYTRTVVKHGTGGLWRQLKLQSIDAICEANHNPKACPFELTAQ